MIEFAALLERLVFTPSRNAKLALLRAYFTSAPDPDRGYALAAMAGDLRFSAAKPGLIRALAASRMDPVLFDLSYDYVGDLAETVALMWKGAGSAEPSPRLGDVVVALEKTPKSQLLDLLEGWLDASDASERFAILKLMTGGLRVGASARLAKLALADIAGVSVDEIEEIWHGLTPPYTALFAWIEGHAERPDPGEAPVFRPTMLAHPLEETDFAKLDPAEWQAEWKWDGIRVQLVRTVQGARIYTRTADDIGRGFPEIVAAIETWPENAVLDGELLVMRDGSPAPFSDLQQRLNRKSPTSAMLRDFPAGVRLYDMLFDDLEDIRTLGFAARRARLEAWYERVAPALTDLSPLIGFSTMEELSEIREGARAAAIEGLMLKKSDSPYVSGRPKGLWWKWKREALTVDCVMMYAQRGHGRRSSYYSDYTFGLWRTEADGAEVLVPIGKAYSGITDEELAFLDKWVRNHTIGRFGPVREVEKSLVLEIAYDAAQRSTRHKSGVALRFPRIARIRADKPAGEADRLAEFAAMNLD